MTKPINTLSIFFAILITLFSCVNEEGHTIDTPYTSNDNWADTLKDSRYLVNNDVDDLASIDDIEWSLLQRNVIITPRADLMLTSPYLPWTGTITINGVDYDPSTFSYMKPALSGFFAISNDSVMIKVFIDHIEISTPSYNDMSGEFSYNADSIRLKSSEAGFFIDIQAPTKTLIARQKYRFAETRAPEEKVDTLLFKTDLGNVYYGKGTTITGADWTFNGFFSTSNGGNIEISVDSSIPNRYEGNSYNYEYVLIKDKVTGDGITNGLILYEDKNVLGIVGRALYLGIGFKSYEVNKVELEHEYHQIIE
ncbi:MAG: hypothetical protein ACK5MG_03355 [Bacteroidales bacterium]